MFENLLGVSSGEKPEWTGKRERQAMTDNGYITTQYFPLHQRCNQNLYICLMESENNKLQLCSII